MAMVHGSWTDARTWNHVLPALAAGFRVLTYDRRGHSRSERPATAGSLVEDAADLAGLLERLGLGPAHLVGNSFGASVALRLAIDRPELVRSLAVHEPPVFALLEGDPVGEVALSALGARVAAAAGHLRAGRIEEGARAFVDSIALGPGAWEERLSDDGRAMFLHNASTWLDELDDPAAHRLPVERLSGSGTRVLLTWGDASPAHFALVAERMRAMLPGAEGGALAGAAHTPHLSHPEDFAAMVAGFARGEPARWRSRG
jgi:pimeloyl-ACP methyl ester carboxylesterase